MNLSAYDKIRIEKNHDKGITTGIKYAISAMQGWRYEMEDAHCAKLNPYGLRDWAFFAVFDGHGGNFCSNKCSGNSKKISTRVKFLIEKFAKFFSKQILENARNNCIKIPIFLRKKREFT